MHVVRDGRKYVVADDHDWFWKRFSDYSWEPHTFKIFDKFLDKTRNFVDIGAWIGPTVLYAAPNAKKVFAFEPDPVAYKSLTKNLTLNEIKNVVPYPIAVADRWRGMKFGAQVAFGDSESSELWAKSNDDMVAAISLEAVILDLQPNFIKIDIEGGEKTIFDNSILAMQEVKPTIHLSLHTPWFKDSLEEYKKSIIECIENYPYFYDQDLNEIELEDAFDVNAFNSIVATYQKI